MTDFDTPEEKEIARLENQLAQSEAKLRVMRAALKSIPAGAIEHTPVCRQEGGLGCICWKGKVAVALADTSSEPTNP